MGDARRGLEFARYIVKNFPKAQRILVVADGKGQVSRKLANKKRSSVVVEKKPRWEGRGHKRVSYIKGEFSEDYTLNSKVDLIVGMHPDEATGEIVRYAVKNRLPFAVVPCCIKGRDAKGVSSYGRWLNKLRSMAKQEHYDTWESQLHMRGKSIVLSGRPR